MHDGLPPRPALLRGLEWAELDGGHVLHDEAAERIHHLNASAAVVLQLCDGRHTIDEIIGLVRAGYALGQEPEIEVRTFLREAHAQGLLEHGASDVRAMGSMGRSGVVRSSADAKDTRS